jgi:tRNA U34 5-methylaminomethyl-2-thiouridine-forming methyltransferase MnmC
MHGAIQESEYIFIKKGLKHLSAKHISILEIGFGTGLNAFLSLLYAIEAKIELQYDTIEKFPLAQFEWGKLNYASIKSKEHAAELNWLHETPWEQRNVLNQYFSLRKYNDDIRKMILPDQYDLIYFDAFAPEVQPELWTRDVFSKIHAAMKPFSALLTYSSKGLIRRLLEEIGFKVERLPGPPGKRQIMRAIKL